MPSANLRYNATFPLDSLHLFASQNAMPVTSPTYQPASFAYEPFRPALQERFLARFYQAARSLVHQTEPQREDTIRTEVEWAITSQGNPHDPEAKPVSGKRLASPYRANNPKGGVVIMVIPKRQRSPGRKASL